MSVGGMMNMARIKYFSLYLKAKTELVKMIKAGWARVQEQISVGGRA